MYQFLLNSDKSLIATEKIRIYQKEKLIDKIQFILPKTYNGLDLSIFTKYLVYVDQESNVHTEILEISNPDYKDDYFTCVLPVDTDLTRYAGDIELKLQCSYFDPEQGTQYVLTSSENTITIYPIKDLYGFVPDSTLDVVTQKIGELDAKIAALDRIGGVITATQVDDLELDGETDRLYVTAHGERVGNGVEIVTGGDNGQLDGETDGIIDVNNINIVEI